MNTGIVPRKSSSVCNLTADFPCCAQARERHSKRDPPSWNRKHRSSPSMQPPVLPGHTDIVPWESESEPNRHRSASHVFRWLSPRCCVPHNRGTPCDIADDHDSANRLRCLADSRGRSTAQMTSPETDPNKITCGLCNPLDIEPHSDETVPDALPSSLEQKPFFLGS